MKHQPIFLLDFDGVIVDTLDEAYTTHRLLMKKLKKKSLTKERFRLMLMDNIFVSYRKLGVREKDFGLFMGIIEERNKQGVAKVSLYPNIVKLIKALAKYRPIIISSSSTQAIKRYLETEKILRHFKEIQGAEKGLSKIAKIKKIVGNAKNTASNIYYVTDTVGDVIEARKAKVKIIAVGWGYHYQEELLAAEPDYFFNTKEEFIKELPNL